MEAVYGYGLVVLVLTLCVCGYWFYWELKQIDKQKRK